jgi:hypothetical protein
MKRFILSALFFVALLSIWHLLVLAKVWSVVLLPDPISVWEYLKGAAGDGTLVQASLVTMRRLLAGYIIGVAVGLPLGLLAARFKFCEDTIGVLALGLQTLPSVCWVLLTLLWFGQTETAMLFVVIMGTLWSVIIATDNGVRNVPPIFARAARTMGSKGSAQLVQRHPARVAGIHRQRHETRLGIRVAFADGGGDPRDDFDRLWTGPFAALWPRTKCHGPGNRRHACHCRHRSASGQNCVCAVGALSPSAMGHRTSLMLSKARDELIIKTKRASSFRANGSAPALQQRWSSPLRQSERRIESAASKVQNKAPTPLPSHPGISLRFASSTRVDALFKLLSKVSTVSEISPKTVTIFPGARGAQEREFASRVTPNERRAARDIFSQRRTQLPLEELGGWAGDLKCIPELARYKSPQIFQDERVRSDLGGVLLKQKNSKVSETNAEYRCRAYTI